MPSRGLPVDGIGVRCARPLSSSDPGLWDREAATFDEAPDHGLLDPEVREAWRELLLGVLPVAPADVVDLGCGTGTLTRLLADDGYTVDAVDFSPAMVRLADAKLAGSPRAVVRLGDAGDPGLAPASTDVVLCRHLLWALPEPERAVVRWVRALRPGGRLVLVEGTWSTGAGLTAKRCASIVEGSCARVEVRPLPGPALWGGETTDDRYIVVARP
ncbi:class I SAM-dependent methyltransferase [Fodinibacter luteus]|uniref:Class I SAM-dependent methyltransferase n=1 Tax=Fodinibacter luteus TaxID=552064 RepID=A0ABP8KL53_9MICO